MLVIGIGNELRGDDAAGLEAARLVRERTAGQDVTVRLQQADPSALLDQWEGARAVVLVDAMRSGAPPGTIRRFDASEGPLPAGLRRSTSTHAIGLADAIELARALGRLPGRIVVFAIEGAAFEAGAGLSDAVLRKLDPLAGAVLAECTSACPPTTQP